MKEKIINYIERLEAESLQADDYFKQRNDLYIQNQEKDKEIERLKEELEKLNAELRRYKSIVYLCEKVKDGDKE